MEFTGSAAGARVAKASEAADGAGSMLKSQEKVELSKPYLNEGNRIKGPSAISGMRNSGKPPLSPPKDKIRVFEAQFKQTLLDRATLEKQLSQSIKNTEDYVDEMMRNMLSNVKELKSLYKEIIQGAGQLPRKDFRQAMAQLKSMLKNTPLREEILDIGELQEKAMLQVYARTVHQQIFQTIDFMRQEELISPVQFERFFDEEKIRKRLARQLIGISPLSSPYAQYLDIPTKIGSSEEMKSIFPGLIDGKGDTLRKAAFKNP